MDPASSGTVPSSSGSDGDIASPADLDTQNIPYDKTLTPFVRDNFRLTWDGISDDEVTFIKDGSGAYTWLRDRSFVAKRGTGPQEVKLRTSAPSRIPPHRTRGPRHRSRAG